MGYQDIQEYLYYNYQQTTKGKSNMTLTEYFINKGFTRNAAEIAAADVNTILDIIKSDGSLKVEAVIGFCAAVKERGLPYSYAKGVINIAKSLSKCK